MRRATLLLLVTIIVVLPAHAAQRRRAVRHPTPAPLVPVATADSYAVDQGATLAVAAPGVLANDVLNGATLVSFGASSGNQQTTFGANVQTTSGLLSVLTTGAFTYTPQPGFSGTDSFAYVLSSASGSATGIVTITVRAGQLSALGDAYATAPDTDLFIPPPGVLSNDIVAGATIISYGPVTGSEQTLGAPGRTSSGGFINLDADGSFSYSPPDPVDDGYGYTRSFRGTDSFMYVLRNGATTASARVTVLVEVPQVTADFTVTTPGFYYAISGQTGQNPQLTLKRGKTYTFQINAASGHPFAILDAPPGSVTNNDISSGVITFEVPATAQNYRYRCTNHDFGNAIVTVP